MLDRQCNRTATGLKNLPPTHPGWRQQDTSEPKLTEDGYWTQRIPLPPLAQEHSLVNLQAEKVTSSTQTDEAGIKSPTARL
jgi:hypothetical protein